MNINSYQVITKKFLIMICRWPSARLNGLCCCGVERDWRWMGGALENLGYGLMADGVVNNKRV